MKISEFAESCRGKMRGFESPKGAAYGAFLIPFEGRDLRVIASDGALEISEGWEHVSVSLPNRCPNWREMSFIKDHFWSEQDTVIQFHPQKSEYINNHPHCLHLWKPPYEVTLPPYFLVGLKNVRICE